MGMMESFSCFPLLCGMREYRSCDRIHVLFDFLYPCCKKTLIYSCAFLAGTQSVFHLSSSSSFSYILWGLINQTVHTLKLLRRAGGMWRKPHFLVSHLDM